jgi:hypothetical protein
MFFTPRHHRPDSNRLARLSVSSPRTGDSPDSASDEIHVDAVGQHLSLQLASIAAQFCNWPLDQL